LDTEKQPGSLELLSPLLRRHQEKCSIRASVRYGGY
jgi:hypothetical protein